MTNKAELKEEELLDVNGGEYEFTFETPDNTKQYEIHFYKLHF